MKELRATHPMSNMQIVERFIGGIRYIKVTPKNLLPSILERLKQMFDGRAVEFQVSESGWIKVIKTGQDPQLNEMVKKAGKVDEEEVDEMYILNKEAEMLRKQGFNTKIIDI